MSNIEIAIENDGSMWVKLEDYRKLENEIKAVEANYDALQTPMPCGHLARYAVNGEEGTQYCVMCAASETEKRLQIAKSALGQIASGKGVYGQQAYQYKELAKSTMEKL